MPKKKKNDRSKNRLSSCDKESHFANGKITQRLHNVQVSDENQNLSKSSFNVDHFRNQKGRTITSPISNSIHNSEANLETQNGKSSKNLTECMVCDVCGRICIDEKSYNRHMKSHSGNRKFKCDYCDKSFLDSCSLKRHMKTHDNEKPFICHLCSKSFRDSASLLRHEGIHKERYRLFHCSVCNKSFMDKHGLKRHDRVHTGLRPYSCKLCQKSFSDSGSLKRHLKIHIGVKNFSCSLCKKSFLEKQSLIRHQKKVCMIKELTPCTETGSNENQACDSLGSVADQSESSVDGRGSISDCLPVLIPSNMFVSNTSSEIKSEADIKSSHELPSLHSLMKKDPKLSNNISKLVESIDSYEKMLHLCGDIGQLEIDAALAKDSVALPDIMLCFECGELLVEGENFRSTSRVQVTSCPNSYKCLNCEEDYGDPPLLKPEVLFNNSNNSFESESICSDSKQDISQIENSADKCKSDLTELLKKENTASVSKTVIMPTSESKMMKNKPYLLSRLDYIEPNSNEKNLKNVNADQSSDAVINYSLKSPSNTVFKLDESISCNEPPSFRCSPCNQVFTSSTHFDQHLNSQCLSRYACLVCEKTFMNSTSLRRHMPVHTGEKPYSCLQCGKQFRDPSNFSKHKKACSGTLEKRSSDSSSSLSHLKVENSNKVESKSDVSVTDTVESSESINFMSATQRASRKRNQEYHQSNRGIKTRSAYCKNESDTKLSPNKSEQCNKGMSCSAKKSSDKSFSKVMSNLNSEKENLFTCKVCSKEFTSDNNLLMHMSYHTRNSNVTCSQCGKKFCDSYSLKRHARIHAGARPHICQNCNRGYCDNWSLKKHKTRGCMLEELKVSPDSLHPCPQCSRVFSEVHFLQEHIRCHKGLLKFQCDICLKKFSEAFNLKRHRRLHMVTCPVCQSEFHDMSSFSEHQKICRDKDSKIASQHGDGFPCPICARVYSTKSYLERHKKFHSNLKPHVCMVCNKQFSESFRLKRHMKVHNSTRPFTCERCKKGFKDALGLSRHKMSSACKYFRSHPRQVQPPQTDYPCQICKKIFKKSYLLIRHMAVHSQERPFSCDTCGKSYKDTSSLKRHQFVHAGIKNFICSVCSKGFYYSDSLKRHKAGSCGKKLKVGKRLRKSHRSVRNKNSPIKCEKKISPADVHTESNVALDQKLIISNGTSQPDTESNNSISVSDSIENIKSQFSSHQTKAKIRQLRTKVCPKPMLFRQAQFRKQYQCPICFLGFSRKFYLDLHCKVHNS
ncbi:zinc finger protein 62 [Biomphalaria glabrata]|nr:zinc finger protein 62 [Biomphalaria glabrata]